MASYGPEGTPNDIFLERTFLAGDFISGVGYGEYVFEANEAESDAAQESR